MAMRLDKAIEILNCHEIPLKTAQDHDFFDAIHIGIEAMKYIQHTRNIMAPLSLFASSPYLPAPHPRLLPGETED